MLADTLFSFLLAGLAEWPDTVAYAEAHREELTADLAEMLRGAGFGEPAPRVQTSVQWGDPVYRDAYVFLDGDTVNVGGTVDGKRTRYKWNVREQRWARREEPPAGLLEAARARWHASGYGLPRPSMPPPELPAVPVVLPVREPEPPVPAPSVAPTEDVPDPPVLEGEPRAIVAEFKRLALEYIRETWPPPRVSPASRAAPREVFSPRINPAPAHDRKKGMSVYSLIDHVRKNASPELAQAMRDRDHLFFPAAEALLWSYYAPEGWPPYPRRGGSYSADEIRAITQEFSSLSPDARHLKKVARQADARLGIGDGVGYKPAGRVIANSRAHGKSLEDLVREDLQAWASGMTPAEGYSKWEAHDPSTWTPALWTELARASWPGPRLLNLIHILGDPDLYTGKLPIDEAVSRLVSDDSAQYYVGILLDTVYGLHLSHRRTGEKGPTEWNIREGKVKASEALARQRREEQERKEAEALHYRQAIDDAFTLARALQAIPQKGLKWTSANVARVLPPGFKMDTDGHDVGVEGPRIRYIVRKSGTVHDALARMAEVLQVLTGIDLGFETAEPLEDPYSREYASVAWSDAESRARIYRFQRESPEEHSALAGAWRALREGVDRRKARGLVPGGAANVDPDLDRDFRGAVAKFPPTWQARILAAYNLGLQGAYRELSDFAQVVGVNLAKLSEGARVNPAGGMADGIPFSAFDSDQLMRGTLVEMEHTDDPQLAREIAADHLAERPDYYDVLERSGL